MALPYKNSSADMLSSSPLTAGVTLLIVLLMFGTTFAVGLPARVGALSHARRGRVLLRRRLRVGRQRVRRGEVSGRAERPIVEHARPAAPTLTRMDRDESL